VFEGKRPEADLFGEPMAQMTIAGGVAIIPVFGPLMQHASLLDKQCGATSYDDIREDLETAAASRVDCVVLNIDSPGGQVTGCQETGEFIVQFQIETGIPCYAFTDRQMCSAAYWLACSCEQIFGTRSAMVGSIGVIMGFLECSEKMKMEGIKAEIFTSGKYKAAGNPALAVTDEQREYLQGLVADGFASFAEHVLARRPGVQMESMEGQVMFGAQAQAAGLVDECVDGLKEVEDFFQAES